MAVTGRVAFVQLHFSFPARCLINCSHLYAHEVIRSPHLLQHLGTKETDAVRRWLLTQNGVPPSSHQYLPPLLCSHKSWVTWFMQNCYCRILMLFFQEFRYMKCKYLAPWVVKTGRNESTWCGSCTVECCFFINCHNQGCCRDCRARVMGVQRGRLSPSVS